MTSVSYVSAQFCVAVDGAGGLVTDYSGTWSAPLNADSGAQSPYGLLSVSCPAVSFCAAVDEPPGARIVDAPLLRGFAAFLRIGV